MLICVSPAKKLDIAPSTAAMTVPELLKDARALARVARGLTADDLKRLMHLSDALARLNADRFAAFKGRGVTRAIDCFAGDTYQGFEAKTLDADTLDYAQDHLCILSGLYGLLRPFDGIEPHRLEMGTRLATPRGASLYGWWGDRIARAINARARATGAQILVNCASQEYFAAVDRTALKLPVITPVFLDEKAGEAKIVSFFAKRARGALARFICENRVTDPAALRDFTAGGYRFQPDQSDAARLVFLRGAADSLAA